MMMNSINGNVTRCLDSSGNTVAQYVYNAFGNTIGKSGPMCDFFRHRFSTKYLDIETGLYYYGYRFYCPWLMRWINRDTIEENGGDNLYAVCGNNLLCCYDAFGQYWTIKRSFAGAQGLPNGTAVNTWESNVSTRGFFVGYSGWAVRFF